MASAFDEWQRGLNDRGLALEEALELAYGGGLQLQDVEYSANGELVFIFKNELNSLDQAWRFLFGVGATAAKDPNSIAWFKQHPEMDIVRDHCRRAGNRFIITQGARFAYAQLRSDLKDQYPFLARLKTDLAQHLTAGQTAFANCFAKRFSADDYISCLMEKARNEWRQLTGTKVIIGGIPRVNMPDARSVKPLDRQRVLAVLNAWAQDSDYMDNALFNICLIFRPKLPAENTRPFKTESCEQFRIGVDDYVTAEKLLSMPAFHRGSYNCSPTPGAVVRIKEVLEDESKACRELRDYTRVFGNSMGTEIPELDHFFTSLLEWDSNHCYGLLMELHKMKTWFDQGGGELPAMQRGAYQWVGKQFRAGELPYAAYPLINDEDDMLDNLLDLYFGG